MQFFFLLNIFANELLLNVHNQTIGISAWVFRDMRKKEQLHATIRNMEECPLNTVHMSDIRQDKNLQKYKKHTPKTVKINYFTLYVRIYIYIYCSYNNNIPPSQQWQSVLQLKSEFENAWVGNAVADNRNIVITTLSCWRKNQIVKKLHIK